MRFYDVSTPCTTTAREFKKKYASVRLKKLLHISGIFSEVSVVNRLYVLELSLFPMEKMKNKGSKNISSGGSYSRSIGRQSILKNI